MKKVKLTLGDIENIKKFVWLNEQSSFDVDAVSNRYVIDGKSILGMLSLDNSKEITIAIHEDDGPELEDYLNKLQEIIAYKEV